VATRYAIDTNILVYAFDTGAPAKQAQALGILETCSEERAIVPAQALAEAARVLLGKRRPPLPGDDVLEFFRRLVRTVHVEPLTENIVMEAVRAVEAYGLSYFDAQIWAAARRAGASMLLSEDFQDGRVIEGVRFMNPFRDGFILA
jgi:predicted nucleic acid-binding protein